MQPLCILCLWKDRGILGLGEQCKSKVQDQQYSSLTVHFQQHSFQAKSEEKAFLENKLHTFSTHFCSELTKLKKGDRDIFNYLLQYCQSPATIHSCLSSVTQNSHTCLCIIHMYLIPLNWKRTCI